MRNKVQIKHPQHVIHNSSRFLRTRGTTIGYFNPVIPKHFCAQPVIPMGISSISHPIHTLNPESHPQYALKSRILAFK